MLTSTLSDNTLQTLDERLDSLVIEIEASEMWAVLSCDTSSSDLIRALIREIYWEVHCYQPRTTKAGFTMLGRIPPTELKLMRLLLLHKWEESEHGTWALDGYKAFGGDLTRIGREDIHTSEAAFAVAAVWDLLAKELHPLSYLGAEYLFEDLTARLAGKVIHLLRDRQLSKEGMRFITDHAVEDEKHTKLLKSLIIDVSERYSELRSQMLFSFDCFRHVYPMPVWLGAFERAKRS